jgi:hypothetical protein
MNHHDFDRFVADSTNGLLRTAYLIVGDLHLECSGSAAPDPDDPKAQPSESGLVPSRGRDQRRRERNAAKRFADGLGAS